MSHHLLRCVRRIEQLVAVAAAEDEVIRTCAILAQIRREQPDCGLSSASLAELVEDIAAEQGLVAIGEIPLEIIGEGQRQ